MLKIQNNKLMAKLQSLATNQPKNQQNPIEKDSHNPGNSNPFGRVSYYDQNKENDFKD